VLCLAVFLLLAPASRGAIWRRAGGLMILTVWYVLLQHYGMGFWFELLPGATKIQFPGRLLVFIVSVAIVCMAIATEAALRSPLPFVRVIACALPVVAAAFQGNQARGTQSAIWGLNVERSVADEALADDNDVLTRKVSMNQSWNDFIPHMHGSNPPLQPFLKASDGCLITSPTLTKGVAQAQVENNVAGPISFTTVGKNCVIAVNQIQSSLLQAELSKPGGMRQSGDGMMVIDAPSDGTVVRIHDRGVLDLAKKFLIEKTRRFP
jgi:hypothetical protein